jgi:uncharacterized protein DUF4136
MRTVRAAIIVVLASTLLLADEHSVNFDAGTDFSKIKSYAFRQTRCDSTLPELNNSLYLKNLRGIIGTSLIAKGMTEETADHADVLIDFRFDGLESSSPGKAGSRLGEGRPGTVYAQGTLNIELFTRERNLLVWEGIYRDTEDNASRLARRYQTDAKALLMQYPPKKK